MSNKEEDFVIEEHHAHSLLFFSSQKADKWKNECVKKNASRLITSYKSNNML